MSGDLKEGRMNCKKCNAENDMDCESKCWKCGEKLSEFEGKCDPELNNDNEKEAILKMANDSYKAHLYRGGCRGQMITPQDDYIFHIIQATKRLISQDPPQCEPVAASPDQIELGKLAAFGKSVWDWIKANPDFCGDEFSETFLLMAEEAGLCRKEPYDPEKHGEIEYGEVGFDIWTWD